MSFFLYLQDGDGKTVETKTIVLWNHEAYACNGGKASKTFEVEWNGDLKSATLYLDLDPELPPFFDCATKVIVNGFEYDPRQNGDPCDKMVFDITDALRQGRNEVTFEFTPWATGDIFRCGYAYGYVTVQAEEIVKAEPPKPPEEEEFWKYLPWMIGGVFAIAGLGVVGYLISSLKK